MCSAHCAAHSVKFMELVIYNALHYKIVVIFDDFGM